jgi:hypothetical protein
MTILIALFAAAPAQAQLDCEQLGVVAEATVVLRNQGASLHALLADAGTGEMRDRFSAEELRIIRGVIEASFERVLSPIEILQACRDGAIVLPGRGP